MKIYLTDTQQHIDFPLGKPQDDIQVLLTLKKIIPSIIELMLPVLPESKKTQAITWESTSQNFELFKKIYQSWGVLELRLKALNQYKGESFVHQLLVNAQQYRKEIIQKYEQYSVIETDYLFFLYIHTMIDSELVDLGEKFYVPTFKKLWENEMKDIKTD